VSRRGRGAAAGRPRRLGARRRCPAARGDAPVRYGPAGCFTHSSAYRRAAGAGAAADGCGVVRRGRADRRHRRRGAGGRARVGPPARAPAADRGRDPASGAPHSLVSRERTATGGAARAGAGEGSDSEVVKRREFLTSLHRYVATTAGLEVWTYLPSWRRGGVASPLIPVGGARQ